MIFLKNRRVKMIKNFRTYELAVEFYRLCLDLSLERYLKDQLNRAASSIALNLAEGSGRSTAREQKRFFDIAMGSLRESQAVLDLAPNSAAAIRKCGDQLGANLFCLIQAVAKRI
jgi:four helix bundle protein